jgi:hypothetical protein
MVAAIGESLEAILDRHIVSSFQPNFKGRPSPAKCVTSWQPVVDTLAALAHHHLLPILKASGPPRELSQGALENFRNHVEMTVDHDDEKWKTFAGLVKLTP